MHFSRHSDTAKCQLFSTCLQGTTLKWFNSLQLLRPSLKVVSPVITDQGTTISKRKATAILSNDFVIHKVAEECTVGYLVASIDKHRHG